MMLQESACCVSRLTLLGSSRSASLKLTSALVPLASPSRDIGQRFRNLAAIGQERSCLFEVTHRSVVIYQAGVVVITLGQDGLAEIGLESERGFGCLSRLFAQGDRWLKRLLVVAARFHV